MTINNYLDVGRRKTAVARIKISSGNGKVIINNKSIDEYFHGLERQKQIALKPVCMCKNAKNYDFYININGGGISGQAGAISHCLSKVIIKFDETSKAILKSANLLRRDSRMVERKKPGRPKARKRFQFAKR
ncbi:MAG: 30S ribosomal protein S9 [Endomicrobium sp.]|jgi:small subunit ribosomal protein S9|nr:30S ribosomal protein S9 [Endomicrobium sp.]